VLLLPLTGIALRLADVERGNHTIDDEGSVALAAQISEVGHRTWVRHLHPERLGQLGASVREERHDRASDALVLRPAVHHRAVVDAVDQHLLDPGCLELVLSCKVSPAVHIGKKGSERGGV